MPRKSLRRFPREHQQGSWPLLQVTPEDRSFMPLPEAPLARRWRLIQSSLDLVALDMGIASIKGVMLGLFAFSLIFSFLTLRMGGFCWWVGWHWAIGIGALAVLLLLIGFDLTLVIVGAVALWLSFRVILTQPLMPLLFIGGGVIIACIIEFFPRKP